MANDQPAQPQVPTKVTSGIPDKTVVVLEGTEVHTGEGKQRKIVKGGELVTMPGPEADDLVLAGYATYTDD